jgi:radical SAM superfamily enzyme YgiQ (UPF0313 family)
MNKFNNIVLSQALIGDAEWNRKSFPPLGLMYISSAVKKLPDTNVNLVDGYSEGLSTDLTAARIIDLEPDILGMSMTSENFLEGLEVIRKVKEARPGVTTVAGGIHAGLFDDLLLKESPSLDYVLRGEAEESFPELVDRLRNEAGLDGLPGLSYRRHGDIVRGGPQVIRDLDCLVPPDRTLIDGLEYGTQWYGFDIPQFARMTTTLSSRGCPHSCFFCSDVTFGARFRTRSPENILRELIEVKRLGYEIVIFFDDNFTGDVERVNQLCRLIIDQRLGLSYACTAMPYLLPQETLDLMQKAGFFVMFVGVESGSDEMLKLYRKPARRELLMEGIRRAKQANFLVIASFITGHREETPADFSASKDYMRLTRPFFCEINPLMVHPGSALWQDIHGNHPPETLLETRSRLISRFPGQMEKADIKAREKDFRKSYQGLWRHWPMWFDFLKIMHQGGYISKLFRALLKKPLSILPIAQLVMGGRPR